MYTEQDGKMIRQRIKKYSVSLAVGLAILLAAFIVGLSVNVRSKALTMAAGIAMFAYACFMWVMLIYPCVKYNRFLKDMQEGLTKEIDCEILEIVEKEEMQDGVRVLPVHVFLEDEQDERILYVNVSKLDQLPKKGEKARLGCFGRHIKEARAL